MNTCIKALVAGALTCMMAGTASAHGRVGFYAEVRPYHPPAMQVQRHYVPVPTYYQDRYVYVQPAWQARRDWRHNHYWRRDYRGDRCGHHHHHHWRR